ncbi:TPA: peptide ABC transporter substrate-binding protein [Providencia stuartii]|uniref:peptide ABC transporter substrate-binding protein n=1 Tax=Providencia stuartii TaxID=588 RepID=UPI000537B9F8|nr:peptide ABC transporter substrate-binding protein [Providencia stuartii]AXO17130.1 peptide ABC transporter substrate-binding protein [Providencia stuartii]MBN5592532.1 peptide ABC transporter substrate-binding protein [Providencia stuartii]HEM6906465.1 peptide ABC transporter substrate-binding protein [Providencia stuartii]HEM7153880.1 peptide ABC transporter substrate-binding protein [Providencia stuartii]HEM7522384.1 peptide ABC transporter substrate-binding protein [Providencia stuartii]
MHKRSLSSLAIIFTAMFTAAPAVSAIIPAGTVLAEKQEVTRHLKDEPASLDPIKSVGLTEAQVMRDLFEGLVNQDSHGKPIPGVAQSWSTTDNKTWMFKLRPDARWSNGDPVTADDFVYSWRRLVMPENTSPFAWFGALAGINNAQQIIDGKLPADQLGVEAIDKRTLKITLDKPIPYFPSLTANFSLFPVHAKTVEKYGADWIKVGNLVGNGAFILSDRMVNEKIVLTPNPFYWDHANTVITKVTFVPINQESNATNRYLAGDLDITESFPKQRYQKLLADIPNEVFTPDQLGTYYYAFNTQRAPTNDARVRKALSMTIDRNLIAKKVLGTGEKPANRFTPDVTAGFKPQKGMYDNASQKELDEKAKALLHSAGYGPNNPLRLVLLYNSSENHQKIAIAVASMWKKKLGAEVKLVNQEWKTYIDSRNTGNFDVIRASWIGDFNEPSTFLSLLTAQHSGNIPKFNSKRYDEVMASASIETNEELRNRYYNQAEEIIAQEAPIAPIYQYTNGRLIKPWLKGYPIENPEDVAYSHSFYIIEH